MRRSDIYDVILLGSGIAGTLLGIILARHGLRVVLIEKGSHPRFAVGESTVPETTFLFDVLSKRYDVPELGHIRNYQKIRRHVSSACGIKRGFSFAYHREGQEHRAEESSQFPTWGPPFGPDVHLFRQDIDAYLASVAVRYGADLFTHTTTQSIAIDQDGVALTTGRGEVVRGDFIVDASGYDSPLVKMLGLREEPCPLATRSRTIFTHMVGVPAYDGVAPEGHGLPYAFSQGTLHHLFPGGWFWVIPFDNHPSSTNPLCSVGVSVDLAVYPPSGQSAEEEFWSFVRRFPSIDRHLRGARAARGWVSTGRLQYVSKRGAGDRFFLMPHAYGFVDALFSGGLSHTAATTNALAGKLLAAARDNDFSEERFQQAEASMCRGVAHHDRLVALSYFAMGNYELWNAWHRIWMLGSTFGATGHVALLAKWERDRDPSHFDRFDEPPYRGTQSSGVPEFKQLFDRGALEIDRAQAGAIPPSEAARRIYGHLDASGLCPDGWRLTDPRTRCPTTFTLTDLARLAAWGYLKGPPALRQNFDLRGRVLQVFRNVTEDAAVELHRSASLVTDLVRDAFVASSDKSR